MNRTQTTLAILRIITGMLVAYHGLEVFDGSKINDYLAWERIKALPAPRTMVYVGKATELLGGLALALGLFTRIAASAIAAVFLFITFYLGDGRFWYEEQHPFLFILLAALYLFAGGGKWSMDNKLRKKE
jgi:putative oxidoreductase